MKFQYLFSIQNDPFFILYPRVYLQGGSKRVHQTTMPHLGSPWPRERIHRSPTTSQRSDGLSNLRQHSAN